MDSLPLFNALEAERQKELGQSRAAASRPEILMAARMEAERIAKQRGEVSADDVFSALAALGFHPEDLGNAAGSIFRKSQYEVVRREKSKRASNHCRWIFVWKLRRGE